MKTRFRAVLIASVLMAVILGGSMNIGAEAKTYNLAGVKKTVLRVSSALPVTHVCWTGYYEPWMKKVTELTKGLVTFEVYKAGELVEGGKEYDGLTKGVIDIAAPFTPIYDASRFPMSDVCMLPLKKSNAVIGSKALELMVASTTIIKDGKTFNQLEYLDKGVYVMPHNVASESALNTVKKEFNTLADVKGTRIRVGSRIHQIYAQKVGFTPVSMPAYDLYDAMSRGAVDGSFIHVADWPAYGFQDLFKYSLTGLNFGHFGAFWSMTSKKWSTLPPVLQEIFKDVSDEVRPVGAKIWDDKGIEVMKETQAKGARFVSMTSLNNDVRSLLSSKVVETWRDYIKMLEDEGRPGKAVVKLWAECVVKAGGELPDGVADLLK
jgi:TRAP-type C4-dicarboxylate transport system substrate-binding protein